MKLIKNSLIKKVCIYIFCTCILLTSIFMSYSNTMIVKAIDEEGYYKTAVGVVLSLLGVIEIAATGGSLTPIASAQIVGGLAMAGIELKDYLTDNGDGTYTISPAFISLVLDEVQKLENSGFHDYKSIQNYDGTYHVQGYCVVDDGPLYWVTSYKYYGDTSYRPFGHGNFTNGGGFSFCIYKGNRNWDTYRVSRDVYRDGLYYSHDQSSFIGASSNTVSFSANIPVFESLDAAFDAFESGDFSGALNYREKPLFEYGSIYAPTYTGGSVTFRKEVLDDFENKLQEVNDKYDKVDDKVNALYDYIYNYGDSGGNTGGGYDFVFDIDSPFDLGGWFDDLFNDPFDFGKTFITSLADFFKEIAEGLKKKFPFSIPWDVYHIFTVFSDLGSPQAAEVSTLSFSEENSGIMLYTVDPEDIAQDEHDAPYFKLPIKVESFGIYEEIIVDMKDFKTLSTFSRTMFSLLFAVFLLKFTLKILSIFGVFGGGDD